jgi:hypothetical protein
MKILFRAYFHKKKIKKKVGRKFIRVRIQIWTFLKVGSGSGKKSYGSATLVISILKSEQEQGEEPKQDEEKGQDKEPEQDK